jgi:hypothetical protein
MTKKHTESTRVPHLRFLGEQDGVPERELKKRLVEYFRHSGSVEAAYLARVAYGGSAESIALCLTPAGTHDHDVAENAGRIFASMFGPHEHMDIVFVDQSQESQLAGVCPPFFDSKVR